MIKSFKTILIAAVVALATSLPCAAQPSDAVTVTSPDGNLVMKFALADGVPTYSLDYCGQAVILPSSLGFELKGRLQLSGGFVLVDQQRSSFDETWQPVWGEEASIRNHYHYAITEAAKHHIMVNAHEAVRPTGLCRTWPNMIGNESAMGNEFRAGIDPGQTAVYPFTRLQGGPMDFTPGIFEMDLEKVSGWKDKMRHTICNQLGLYVTFYSPLQMAADLPENYARFMDAFQFIKDVAVDWDKSIYLMAEPGEYMVTARHPKLSTVNKAAEGVAKLPDGKKGVVNSVTRFIYALPDNATAANLKTAKAHDVWYVGGINDDHVREVSFKLDFLKPGVKYEATIYADAKDADYETNPQAYTITRKKVTAKTVMKLRMARAGGFGITIREL